MIPGLGTSPESLGEPTCPAEDSQKTFWHPGGEEETALQERGVALFFIFAIESAQFLGLSV